MASKKSSAVKRGNGSTRRKLVRGGNQEVSATTAERELAAATFPGTNEGAVSTDAKIVLVGVPGIENVSQGFKDKVIQIADNIGVNPNFLMAIMSFETGGTFSPKIRSMAGSGAVGLIQFMPSTAKSMGTTTDKLAMMSAEEQLDFVARYFAPHKNKLRTIEDTYMAVLFPKAINQGADFVLFREGTKAYAQNRGLDLNVDGVITVGEATAKVRERLGSAPIGTGEILRLGMTGPEVGKLQDELIDLGYLRLEQKATGPNHFGKMTEGALRRFQRDNQLDETSIYDEPSQAAIRQLNEGVARGSRGKVIAGLQMRLVELSYLTLAEVMSGRGIFGPKTEDALKTFQLQHGIVPSGILTDETYRALLASAPTPPPIIPSIDSARIDTVLPANGRGCTTYNREPGGADQFGRASTIRALLNLAEVWAGRQPRIRLQFGDISRRGGGPFEPHKAHKLGLEVDIRPVTNNGREEATNIHAMNYSHELTRELVLLILELNPRIKIIFNDRRLIGSSLTRPLSGHDNHLHVSFPG